MKTKIFLIISLFLTGFYNFSFCNEEKDPAGSVTIQCSPDLYKLTSDWIAEYGKTNPGFHATIVTNEGIDNSSLQDSEGQLFILSDVSVHNLGSNNAWRMVIGRDVIVPVINSANPLGKEIIEQGISSEDLAKFFTNPENPQWSILLDNAGNIPLHYYKLSDGALNANLATFLNMDNIPDVGINVKSGKELIESVQKDVNGLGFCHMKDLMDMNVMGSAPNVMLLPIDRNSNGKIDNFEKIYRNEEAFMRGVWLGKYPPALSNNIYSLASSKPGNVAEISFLTWILTDGQKYLSQNGFFDLVSSERDTKVAMLSEKPVLPTTAEAGNPLQTIVFILFIVIVTGIVVAFLYRYIKIRKAAETGSVVHEIPVFDENSISAPKGIYYDKSHTWAFMEVNGDVKIGIDDFIQHVTGPITRIKMKNPGEVVKKGEKIFTLIQNGKQITIHSPVSGKIKSHNEILATDSSKINTSPYSDGWVYLIEPTNWLRETQFMIMAERYSEWLKYEFTRLKDFLSVSLRVDKTEYAHVVLQDGGILRDNILAEFGPEVWEDFQNNFIDTSK